MGYAKADFLGHGCPLSFWKKRPSDRKYLENTHVLDIRWTLSSALPGSQVTSEHLASGPDAADLHECLEIYFRAGTLPGNFWSLWKCSQVEERCHPASGIPLPRPMVAVVLEDAISASKGYKRQDAAAAAYKEAYGLEAHPEPESIKSDIMELAAFFGSQVSTGGASPEWHKRQMLYLKRARIRPTCPRKEPDGGAAGHKPRRLILPKLQAVPACGPDFQKEAHQCDSLTLRGLVASYRAKLWCLANGWAISLGTVGVERLWRNYQRRARNRARSCAAPDSVNLLLLFRWLEEVAGRVFSGLPSVDGRPNSHQAARLKNSAALTEFLGNACRQQAGQSPPLAQARLSHRLQSPTICSEWQICEVYDLLARGCL